MKQLNTLLQHNHSKSLYIRIRQYRARRTFSTTLKNRER